MTLAATPIVAAAKVIEVAKEKNEPLEPLPYGSVLTSEYIAEIVSRVNQLEERS